MPQSVLIIDDDQDIHDLLEARLRPERVQVHHALDGEGGMQMARECRPDLVLLDVSLPGDNGYHVCRRLLRDPVTAGVPVIFLSGKAELADKVRGFDAGGTDYVVKPFDPAELRARVRAALRTKRYQDLLATRAQIDGLTGLWTRACFERRLREEWEAVQRHGRSLCLVMLEIDDFTALVERWGSPLGDEVLQALGEHLQGTVGALDLPCRYEGATFAVLQRESAVAAGMALARQLRRWLGGAGVRCKAEPVPVSASFGVADSGQLSQGAGAQGQAVVALAHQALGRARRHGKGQICEGTSGPVVA